MIFKDLKARIIFLFSIITYLIAGLSALICARSIPEWLGLLLGFGVMLIALVIHFIAKAKTPLLYIVSSCMNAVATGLSIGAYYASTGVFLSVVTVALIFLPYVVLTYLVCLLVTKTEKKRTSGNILGLTFFCIMIPCIIFWKRSTLFSFGLFSLLIVIFYFILAMKNLKTPRNILSDLSFASFGFYLLVAYIVAILISDGDAADILPDPSDLSSAKKHHKQHL